MQICYFRNTLTGVHALAIEIKWRVLFVSQYYHDMSIRLFTAILIYLLTFIPVRDAQSDMLIDQRGNLVSMDASRPSNADTETTIRALLQ